jgi:hypothetical protein
VMRQPLRRSPHGTPRPLSHGCGRPQRFRPSARPGRTASLSECCPRPLHRHWRGAYRARMCASNVPFA